uniref:Uncharacterized protein n=1 Tax=viral metagenome TaxID=1070528 RepID=A0A6M3LAZ9_9ZZZZ
MGWLIGYTLASITTAMIVVKIFDYVFAEVSNGLVSTARFVLFVATWTVVTAKAGMNGFTKRLRRLRQGKIR